MRADRPQRPCIVRTSVLEDLSAFHCLIAHLEVPGTLALVEHRRLQQSRNSSHRRQDVCRMPSRYCAMGIQSRIRRASYQWYCMNIELSTDAAHFTGWSKVERSYHALNPPQFWSGPNPYGLESVPRWAETLIKFCQCRPKILRNENPESCRILLHHIDGIACK
jgi:hypothetical protein